MIRIGIDLAGCWGDCREEESEPSKWFVKCLFGHSPDVVGAELHGRLIEAFVATSVQGPLSPSSCTRGLHASTASLKRATKKSRVAEASDPGRAL